ncbi:Centrosomal protein of 41 kDa [Saguinus oedipus]|uniref:Centrosomal protein of 41 kDa n=1 Tax=Saguinus oedipus TaxID=9490 RepID=A0ABQ9UHS1_SAGOE|nr:Centrosomal protein of 41 kDa [Saguinus oedipus]
MGGLIDDVVIQVASLSDQTLEVTAEEIQRLEDNDSTASDPDAETIARTNGKGSPGEQPPSPEQFINNVGAGDSSRSTLQSVISGVGELDLDKGPVKKAEPNTKDKPYPDCPFLLLDKNAHGKIIILYDDDERLASQAATTMCERGFENLFMLSGELCQKALMLKTPTKGFLVEVSESHVTTDIFWCNLLNDEIVEKDFMSLCWPQLDDQILEDMQASFQVLTWPCHINAAFSDAFLNLGLKVLAQKFPEGLITGSLPASCQQALPPGSARKRSSPKVPPLPAENKWRFTPEDLKKIEYYLEEEQGPADHPSKIF